MKIYTDGGSRGNPGQAALGVYIEGENGKTIAEIGKTIGIATNNVAEYSAVIAAFEWVLEHKGKIGKEETITFYFDSLLVYSQIIGTYKVKHPVMRELIGVIREKEAHIANAIRYFHVPREENKKADALVNRALDNV